MSESSGKAKLLTKCHICGSKTDLSPVSGACWPCIEAERKRDEPAK